MRDLVEKTCPTCRMTFAIPSALSETAARCGEKFEFFCPAGHGMYTPIGDSTETVLRRERDRLKQNEARLISEVNTVNAIASKALKSASAYKGVATRMKNRAKAGVCPCCNRSFENLARHMKSKHPNTDNVIEMGQPKAL